MRKTSVLGMRRTSVLGHHGVSVHCYMLLEVLDITLPFKFEGHNHNHQCAA